MRKTRKDKWTQERVTKQFIPDEKASQIRFPNEILGANSKFEYLCPKCEQWRTISCHSFFGKGSRCRKCLHRKYTITYCKSIFIPDETASEIRFPYCIDNIDSKLEYLCPKCNNWKLITCEGFFYHKNRCKDCYHNAWTIKRCLLEFIPDETASLLRFNTPVIDAYSSIEFLCPSCNEWRTTTCNTFFNSKSRCFSCKRGDYWDNNRVLKEFTVDEYSKTIRFIKEITTNKDKFEVECAKCLKFYPVSCSKYFNSGRRCPRCPSSQGNKLLIKTLEILGFINGLTFKDEYRFKGNDGLPPCKNFRYLPFDAVILHKRICIEVQGADHSRPVRRSPNQTDAQINKRFEEIKHRDAIKKQWCKDNGFTLIEIFPHELKRMKEILISYLF